MMDHRLHVEHVTILVLHVAALQQINVLHVVN